MLGLDYKVTLRQRSVVSKASQRDCTSCGMSMVFNSLAVESELGGVFDGTGLSSQRPRRRRNSGEEEPG